MTPLVALAAILVGTYLLRVAMFVVVRPDGLPGWLDHPLALVAPAALAALVASMVLTDGGRVAPLPVPQLAAVVVGLVVVRRTGNVMHAVVVGLPVMWLLAVLGL